ncbi:NAD(P)-dependent oxidoreductase [Candidatus Pacearchaeota archaeon]|nr:NAD(P)-dependent oxidoreductase [Candidatus Pacearchaeota archaeon]
MNIVITGHKGLIGSYLKDRLEKEGYKIILSIDKRDGRGLADLNKIKIKNINLMIHAAAHCKIAQSISNPEITFRDNVLGTFQVLEFCRKNKIPKILFFSSSRVLNREKSPYTTAKIYGEELCKCYHDSYGIDYIIIRPSTVYGPFWDETRRLIHIFITNALENKPLEIFGDPKTKTLDFTYIDDFVDGVMLALSGPLNSEYNISGDEEYNIYKLAKLIIEETKSKSRIIIKNPETAQPQKVKCDILKIKNLGYKPKYSVEEGVRKTIEWYREF